MDTLSIRIKIADREYPLKVKAEEEEVIRKTAKTINERIKAFREQFGIDDKQDLLAMMLFENLVEQQKYQEQLSGFEKEIEGHINLLNKALSTDKT